MKKCIAFFVALFFLLQLHAQKFAEVSSKVGLNYIYPGNDNQEVGSGIVVFDVNNDGWDDFFQAGGVFQSKLWINKKGKFIDATKEFGLDTLQGFYIQGGAAADFNNDGYEDLFICNQGIGRRQGDEKGPVLLMNVEGKYFKPVFTQTFSKPGNYTSCTWGDYNNDGFVDLFVTDYVDRMHEIRDSLNKPIAYDPRCNENKFYINERGKGFREAAASLGLNNKGCGLACAFTDYDNDGDVDLMLLNDFGEWNHLGNQLYRNDYPENHFTEVSSESVFYKEMYGMGVGPGDYDNDGDLDYFITNIGENFMFQNNGNSFTEIAKQLSIDNTFVKDSIRGSAWSGIFVDIDNDTDLDLYVTKGYLQTMIPKTVIKDPNKLYLNLGNKTFKEISASAGVDDMLSHRGAGLIDFDHDGKVDILSSVIKVNRSEFANIDQKLKLFRNENNIANNWIGFKLKGTRKINNSCIGCSVTIQTDSLVQMKEMDGGSGHGSQGSKFIYFGLGQIKKLEKATIKWTVNGTTILKNLKPNRVYEISETGKKKTIFKKGHR